MPPNEIVPGKETVVQKRVANWAFHLPAQHTIEVDHDNNTVTLAQPDSGSTYELAGIEETEHEVVVKLGAEKTGHATGVGPRVPRPGYRLPEVQDEFERLRDRWRNAGLPEQQFNAWAQGASWGSHLQEIRQALREAPA